MTVAWLKAAGSSVLALGLAIGAIFYLIDGRPTVAGLFIVFTWICAMNLFRFVRFLRRVQNGKVLSNAGPIQTRVQPDTEWETATRFYYEIDGTSLRVPDERALAIPARECRYRLYYLPDILLSVEPLDESVGEPHFQQAGDSYSTAYR